MGLDIRLLRHDPSEDYHARWSYGGFGEFRREIAQKIGIDLNAMVGFGGDVRWADPAEEPLIYLLDHSDCDGELEYEACAALGPRLRAFLDAHRDLDDYHREMALRLAAMCDEVERGDADRVVFE